MNLLIDTHILLWWLGNHPELPRSAAVMIRDPGATIFVSAVTYWEIYLKASLGKLRLPPDFAEVVAEEWFENLPLTAAHAREVGRLPWHHRDPFDRMLIAQARVERLTVITADEALAAYGEFVLVAR